MKREEEHFINQLVESLSQLLDCEIDEEARQIIHRIGHDISHYEFNYMVQRRKDDRLSNNN